MFSRNACYKFLSLQVYLGNANWLKKRNNQLPSVKEEGKRETNSGVKSLVWLGFVVLIILGIAVTWRLFLYNNFHNFICLFYP
jgi:cytochrome b subunit of formate dehydrogenase